MELNFKTGSGKKVTGTRGEWNRNVTHRTGAFVTTVENLFLRDAKKKKKEVGWAEWGWGIILLNGETKLNQRLQH